MANGIVKWLIGVLMVVFAVLIVVAGFKLVTSGGNPGAKEDAKNMIANAIIGIIIVLAAWLMVDTVMKGLLIGGDGRIDGKLFWSKIECSVMAQTFPPKIVHPTPDASRGTAYDPAKGTLTPAQIASIASLTAPDDKVVQAAALAGLDAEQTRNLQALMRVESGGCRSKTSPVGAQGCMQIMPGTARGYDPALKNLSDAEISQKLRDDDNYNIGLGAKIYADLYKAYEGDERKIYAGYNGGKGANEPSKNCPGLMRWECEWNSDGCYNTGKTDCVPNTGYIETRSYVKKVGDVSEKLKG
ncbi:MAG: lytic transglycosylase domain-containing protein [Candidatus Nomurabacteria bacterium]|nr:MAG: lytic transglycosylase domain-containing protein [Candidatus Nomurabacteria bacterium]